MYEMLFLALTAANINIFFRFVKFCEVITADPLVRRKFLNVRLSVFIRKDYLTF